MEDAGARAGMPALPRVEARLARLVADAFAAYAALAEPRAVYEAITPSAFTDLLAPLALPSDALVVGRVSTRAHGLALYVATLGPALPARIQRLFAEDALAEGYMLDAVASAVAELLSERLAAHLAHARAAHGGVSGERTLAYSPGYCGWPTSGQRAFFHGLFWSGLLSASSAYMTEVIPESRASSSRPSRSRCS
jgi:hypothetical protein